jgi:hypothetical protein
LHTVLVTAGFFRVTDGPAPFHNLLIPNNLLNFLDLVRTRVV